MDEEDILRIIYDSVKATRTDNFTSRLARVRLITPFEINETNWPQFLRAASMHKGIP